MISFTMTQQQFTEFMGNFAHMCVEVDSDNMYDLYEQFRKVENAVTENGEPNAPINFVLAR